MLFESGEAFLAEDHKRITLMGMSNIGKTTLAASLSPTSWFHYSVDYRLATAYLKEPMIDVLKKDMMGHPYVATHLREDLMCIDLNVSFENQRMVSHYLGKLGQSASGGLSMQEFRRRQQRHRKAEISAVNDIAEFVARAAEVYGYPHFINDASGSLCELIDPYDDADPVLKSVVDNTVLVYLQADAEHETMLIERAIRTPKPLYYRPDFLDTAIMDYLAEAKIQSADDIEPDGFVRWVFVRLLEARRPRCERIATHGYTIPARELTGATEKAFLERVAAAIDSRLTS
jgi:hypothetical protein